MADNLLEILVTLSDEASAQLAQLNQNIKGNTDEWKSNFGAIQSQLTEAGIAFGAFGAAVTGTLGLAYKAAEDDRLATARLANDLKNVGVAYDSVSVSLNANIEATRKSTGYTSNEQMGALSQLILVTQDYNKATQLLPIALDLAAAKQMDAQTAALLLGRVAEGNVNALSRYGFSMTGVKDPAAALNEIQQRVAGSAQALNSPLKDLASSLDKLKTSFGDLISPDVTNLLDKASGILSDIADWAKKNPDLAKFLMDVGLAFGIAGVGIGAASLAIAGFMKVAPLFAGTLGTILGWVFLLIAVLIFLALNWDTVVADINKGLDFLKAHWDLIWGGLLVAAYLAFGPIGLLVLFLIQLAVDLITHWDSARSFWANIWNSMKIVAKDAINDIVDMLNFLLAPLENIFHFKIGKLTDQMMGIFSPGQQYPGDPSYGQNQPHPGGLIPVPFGPSLPGAQPPINTWGNYGGLGMSGNAGGQTITINVNGGGIMSQQDFMQAIRTAMLQFQQANYNTGIK